MESYFLVRQALACPNYPKHAILSFGADDYISNSASVLGKHYKVWNSGCPGGSRYRETAQRLDDPSFDDYVTFDGFSGWIRNFLYATIFHRFISIVMMEGGVFPA